MRFSPGCACCASPSPSPSPPSIPTLSGCSACPDGAPECFELVVAGITAGGDTARCTNFNGTFTLDRLPSPECVWQSGAIAAWNSTVDCAATFIGAGAWTMQYGLFGAVTEWRLAAEGSGGADAIGWYSLVSGEDPCQASGDVVWAFDSSRSSGCCATWPSTLTTNPLTSCP